MSAPEDLFQEYVTGGFLRIQQDVEANIPENLVLDFKQLRPNSPINNPLEGAKETFAKTVSAFLNTEGGVLIWGIRAKGQRNAVGYAPIPNVQHFQRVLESEIHGCTAPPPIGFVTELILDPREEYLDCGYVAMLIPKSTFKPHQTCFPDRSRNLFSTQWR